KLHRDLKTTFVYVTHDQTEALTMGDRIAIFNAGHLQQVGTPQEVYQRPANLFVATFIGSPQMNLLRGTLEHRATTTTVSGENFSFTVPAARDVRPGAVVVGFRPEHLLPHSQGDGTYHAEVDVVEPMGSEAFVYLRAAEGHVVARVGDIALPEVGSTLQLGVASDKIHLFDPDTEARLL
ncbi:MAG: TOBE domain-containing protein, partial [Candidatus Sericytochromatia bacterium]|nr:TOBE domain-containing protein [Candidatus Sericytochromatia bacterium]